MSNSEMVQIIVYSCLALYFMIIVHITHVLHNCLNVNDKYLQTNKFYYDIGVYYEHNNNFDLGQNYFLPNLEFVWPNSEFVWPRSKSLIIYHC